MSLEALLERNTVALEQNTSTMTALLEVWGKLRGQGSAILNAGGKAETAAGVPLAEKEEKPAAKKSVSTAAKQTTAGDPPSTEAPATVPAADDALKFETVRALVLKLAPTHRDEVRALNAKHGIPKLGALLDDEADFNTVNDHAKLAAIYADLLAMGA